MHDCRLCLCESWKKFNGVYWVFLYLSFRCPKMKGLNVAYTQSAIQQNTTPQPSYPVSRGPSIFPRDNKSETEQDQRVFFFTGTEPTLVTKGAQNTTIEQKGKCKMQRWTMTGGELLSLLSAKQAGYCIPIPSLRCLSIIWRPFEEWATSAVVHKRSWMVQTKNIYITRHPGTTRNISVALRRHSGHDFLIAALWKASKKNFTLKLDTPKLDTAFDY